MPFLDDFNRADQNLEAFASYTHSGIAGAAAVRSNLLASNTTDSLGGLYLIPAQGSTEQYMQAAFRAEPSASVPIGFIAVRATDTSNYIGLRRANGAWELYKRVAGTFTLLGSYTAGFVAGDVGRIEVNALNEIRCYVNGALMIGPVVDSFNSSALRQGIAARGSVLNPWIDNLDGGAMGGIAGGANIPVFVHHYRQQGIM